MDTVTISRKEYLVLKKKAKELDSIKQVSKKLDVIDREIESKKRKLLTAEQILLEGKLKKEEQEMKSKGEKYLSEQEALSKYR